MTSSKSGTSPSGVNCDTISEYIPLHSRHQTEVEVPETNAKKAKAFGKRVLQVLVDAWNSDKVRPQEVFIPQKPEPEVTLGRLPEYEDLVVEEKEEKFFSQYQVKNDLHVQTIES